VARCFDIEPKTLFRWYKDTISDYHQDKRIGKFAAHKVYEVEASTGEILKEQVVHILQPDNLGHTLCIDEKMVDGKYTTILTNHETGKIILLIDTMKPSMVKEAIELLPKDKRDAVRYINADMSPTMRSICEHTFQEANIVIDKFHVIKHIVDALTHVRLTIKNKLKLEKESNKDNPFGWTDLEFLNKTRYLLFKLPLELKTEQQELLNQLFNKFPTLHIAYDLCCQIRLWYSKDNIGKPLVWLEKQYQNWKQNVKSSSLKSFLKVVKMIDYHFDSIIEYFYKGLTNAKAENINNRIQRFITNNYGIKNRDFFFYRIQVYFATNPAPQKKN
jgi:transposase